VVALTCDRSRFSVFFFVFFFHFGLASHNLCRQFFVKRHTSGVVATLSLKTHSPSRGTLHFLNMLSESESYVTTDGQPASLSSNKAPIWGLRPDFNYCLRVAGLMIWGALSDERTGLSFTIAAGPHQRSHFRVRVPQDSWPYFTVSCLRLPFSSPPTTRRVTVEIFDPASTRVICCLYTQSRFKCL
jgi:hypothetical protein